MASGSGTTTEFTDTIQVYGADWCPDCRRAKAVLDAAGVVYQDIDLDADEAAAAKAEAISGMKHIPVVVFPDGAYYVEPTNTDLGAKLQALGLSA